MTDSGRGWQSARACDLRILEFHSVGQRLAERPDLHDAQGVGGSNPLSLTTVDLRRCPQVTFVLGPRLTHVLRTDEDVRPTRLPPEGCDLGKQVVILSEALPGSSLLAAYLAAYVRRSAPWCSCTRRKVRARIDLAGLPAEDAGVHAGRWPARQAYVRGAPAASHYGSAHRNRRGALA